MVKSEDCFSHLPGSFPPSENCYLGKIPREMARGGKTHRSIKTSEKNPTVEEVSKDVHSPRGVNIDAGRIAFLRSTENMLGFAIYGERLPTLSPQSPSLLLTRESSRASVSSWSCYEA